MKEATRELNRLARMHPDSAEASVIRTFLTTMTELPWNERSTDQLDMEKAEEILDEDHYGLEKVKDRVLEYLAVRKLRARKPPRVNCPRRRQRPDPAVRRTARGRQDLDRQVDRQSLGRGTYVSRGGRDESDIRGHRRTYIGSMPGRIIRHPPGRHQEPGVPARRGRQAGRQLPGKPQLRAARGARPAQNNAFVDHYLGVPFDLSECCSSHGELRQPDTEALFDRMELIGSTATSSRRSSRSPSVTCCRARSRRTV